MSTIVLFRIVPRADVDVDAYDRAYRDMVAEVETSPGFLQIEEYVAEDSSHQLAVARFASVADVKTWRDNPEHVKTRDRGRNEFFLSYEITLAESGRSYGWKLDTDDPSAPPPGYYTSEY
jgi:heme-degrading monooxygenase HmoA